MARITFKGKVHQVNFVDGTPAYTCIKIPTLTRNHCNMHEFRIHPIYGSYANSDLFPAILNRIKTEMFGEYVQYIKPTNLPANVTVDTSGFLAVVTITV